MLCLGPKVSNPITLVAHRPAVVWGSGFRAYLAMTATMSKLAALLLPQIPLPKSPVGNYHILGGSYASNRC